VKRWWKNILYLVGVGCVYVALILTRDIQEDAMITFRVAFNLADHGVFSFNLDENYNSVTSFLYPLVIASFRLLFGDLAVPVVQVTNALVVLWSCWIVTKILRTIFDIPEEQQWLMWFLFSIMPHTLVLAVRSMEMPYVVLLFVLALRDLQSHLAKNDNSSSVNHDYRQFPISLILVAVLPFVRPDAVAFSFVVVAVAFFKQRVLALRYLIATLVGIASYLTANYFLWGNVLPNTIAAKTLSYNGLAFIGLFKSWWFVMNEVAFPVDVKQLYLIKPFCGLITAIILIGFLVVLKVRRKEQIPIFLGVVIAIFAIPSAYAFGGVVFPWYLWPAQFLCAGILLGGLFCLILRLEQLRVRKLSLLLLFGVILAFMHLQLARSYNWGVMEGVYRASIGKYIAQESKINDTLFLEPAGYIPFYAKLKTIDEIGLASPIVLKYKKEYPNNWWMNCVKQERPTFLVEREHFKEYCTHSGYMLAADEIRWFNENYKMIKSFSYTPQEYTECQFFRKLLKLSKTHEYYVFKLVENLDLPPHRGAAAPKL
jgi:hypothetical protein